MGQFVFTCLMLIWLFSISKVNAVHSSESPRFKIESKVNLEASISCGKGMFQKKQASMCILSANEDEPGLLNGECSACDPQSNMQLRIDSVLRADNRKEWRSLSKAQDSMLQEINITINFPQVFKIEHFSVKAGSTPLPALWALEESRDLSSDFKALRYYAADQEDCSYFWVIPNGNKTGERPACFLRPNSSWVESEDVDVMASRVRLRFLKVWSDFDYYSVSDILIEGRCDCNGHADECSARDDGLMACHCKHNTCGVKCETCCDGYILHDSGDCTEVKLPMDSTMPPLLSNIGTLELMEKSTTSNRSENATEPFTVVQSTEEPTTLPTTNTRSTVGRTMKMNITTTFPGSTTNEPFSKSTKAIDILEVRNVKSSEANSSESSLENGSHVTAPKQTTLATAQPTSEGGASQSSMMDNTTAHTTIKDTTAKTTAEPDVKISTIRMRLQSTVDNKTPDSSSDFAKETTIQTKSNIKKDATSPTAVQSAALNTTSGSSTEKTNSTLLVESVTNQPTTGNESTSESATEKTLATEETIAEKLTEVTAIKKTTTTAATTTTTTSTEKPTITEKTTPVFATEKTKTTVVATDENTATSSSSSSPSSSSSSLSSTTTTSTTAENAIIEKSTAPITMAADIEKKPIKESKTMGKEKTTPKSATQKTTTEMTTDKNPTGQVSIKETPTAEKTTSVSTFEQPTSWQATTGEHTTVMKKNTTVTTSGKTSTQEITTVAATSASATDETTTTTTTTTTEATASELNLDTIPTMEASAVKITHVSPTEKTTTLGATSATYSNTTETTSTTTTTAGFTTKLMKGTRAATDGYSIIKKRKPTEATKATTSDKTTERSTTKKVTTAGAREMSLLKTTDTSTIPKTTIAKSTASKLENDATKPTPVETTAASTTMEITTVKTTTEATPVKTTAEQATVETTTKPFPPLVDITDVPTTVKTTAAPSTEKSSTVLTTGKSATEGTTLEFTTVPTTVKITTKPFPPLVEISTLPTTVGITTEATTVETTTVPTTVKTATMPTTEKTTTEPFPPLVETTAVPITVTTTTEPTTLRTTVETTTEPFPPLVEITVMPTTVQTTTEPTTVKTTTEPTTVKTTTEPTTVETSIELATVETTTEPTTVKTTTEPTTVKTTTEPTTVKTTTEPTTVETSIELATVETTTEPTTVKTTTEPTTVKTTYEPTTVKTTTEPFPPLVETTAVPTTVKTTTEPTTVTTTTKPTTVKTTTEPTTVTTTSAPTTSGVLTEEQARILFGNLPKGVCYCAKFATADRQCFPKALHKPCICRSNFAGVRCDKCAPGHYNYPFCAPCRCNKLGSIDLNCDIETGRCRCKPDVRGRRCDACPLRRFNFPTCSPCECNPSGTYGDMCDPYNGQCLCRYGFRGRQCDKCPAGYYNFPNCQWCGCNPLTTTENICEDYGGGYRCLCRSNFKGVFCGNCERGYYDFPICKKCLCSPRGYGSCNEFGKCVCDAGYAGSQCDRCANGYYGFPHCSPCGCNTFGSYSTQCNYTTGQCPCKPNIRGSLCDRCAKGMVGFPTCVECDCNPDGTRFLPGRTESMCYGSAKYKCLCKANVAGRTCDRCMHGYFNFSGSNPSGCSPCSCSSRGTVSGTRQCHAQYGQCDCKNHVIGAKCDKCRDGYYGVGSHDIFGCKACKCDPGGSTSRNCFKHLGDCQCVAGVTGKKCNSLYSSRPLYFPTLYQIHVELEGAVLTSNARVRVPIGADATVLPSFSGTGYAIFPAYKPYAVAVYIPKTSVYRVIFHYALRENSRASAKVDLYPRGSKIPSHAFEVQFSPPNPSAQQTKNLKTTVNRRGRNREFQMKKGAWNVVITSHSSMILLDYIAFLPEEYYKAELLKDISSEPCLLRTSKPEYCDMYTYYEPKSPSIVTVSGDKAYTLPLRGQPDVFIDPRFDLSDQKLSNMALLGSNQPTIGFDVSVAESGPYVVMVTYLHPERFSQGAFVRVGYERGQLEILPCKYQFACRQFATDGNKRPKHFELTGTPDTHEIKLESSVSSKIAVISITVIPLAKWNTQYIQPQLQCRLYNKSCIASTYHVPSDAIQLAAFSRRTQDKVTSVFTGAVNPDTLYYVILHYQQTHSLSKKFEHLLIADQVNSNISVTFRYCPTTPGCQVVPGEEDGRRFQFSKGTFTATIHHERRIHLRYILLVPQESYSTSLLELQPADRVEQFIQNCGKDNFHIDPTQAERQCREDVFSLTIGFNGAPLQCRCNALGSKSASCEQFGGQCFCHANVVGRKCDRCRHGHSGFPRCRRCGCHEVGSVSPTCTSNGRCRCKPGFGGYKCNRCKSSGYYGFPDCKLCACNSLGSLSMFCRSRDGQCQCRRNFQGQKCNECKIGYYDFPRCKACSCNPAGIKLLPGQKNGCGSVNNTHCVCKDNVAGDDCDSCKHFTFNLQINNPLGCQSCDCNTNGTLGSIKTCHGSNGQCVCKSHVTGRQCGQCKEGYYNLKSPDVFGCKRCSCNAGGSVRQSCNTITGACTCLRGVGGAQCDRVVSDQYYYPSLHQYKIELEDGLTLNDRSAYFRHRESEFTGFSWRGYVVFTQSQNLIYIMIDVPRTSKYQLIFYYMLNRYAPVTALVKFIPTLDSASFPSGPAREQTVDVRFRSTASWVFAIPEFLVVRDNWGDTQQVMLSQGKWKLTIAAPASDLLVDYLVLLPEEYYRPRNLVVQVSNPCTLSRDERYCVHYTYPNLKQAGFITIQAEDSSVVGGIRRNRRVGDIPFQGLLLSGSRNVMSVRLPSTVRGQFVLIASYFHNSDDEGLLSVVVRTGADTFNAKMSIQSCRYRFGCRQVAIDEKHEINVFIAKPDEVTTVSITTRFTVALDFITTIPLSKWNQKLLIPAEQCASNGFSCIQSSYPDLSDAPKIQIEDRFSDGDRAPYYILDRRARLKHLKVGQKTVYVSGTARSGRYYVIVHFYQPNFLSFLGKVVISGQNAASTLLTFRHCPHVSGCRAIGTSQYREGMSESIYIGRQKNILVSITIPEDKGVWIDYVLLVPISSFSPSLLEIKPIDVTQDFIQDCGQNDFFLKESSSKFCLSSTFTITSKFNRGALACNCDSLGSTKTTCQSFGGQCVCRPNVIGRACDRCKSGYSGFPHCRKPAT